MVTVRTKSRESTSSDSQPTVIPNFVRNAARTRNINHHQQQQQHQQQTNFQQTSIPPHMRNQPHQQQSQRVGPLVNQQNVAGTNHQQILDHHDESLSDKEIFP
ncbi:putative cyclin-dependent serine/threonine-protein kinase DDB_G0272797/DDB_G0274007, partial [Contarinia nasturtii]|uniref:putative cyclin-dependent serine/threonine-protein kinase DDB_G0272797/DDB_G0274007 n=1 Tax=Contarinia nasturtii TaxID=265458 RepID=UPI0012D3DD57